MNQPKRSNLYKVRNPEYKPWTLKDVVEAFSSKTFEQVKKEQQKRNA